MADIIGQLRQRLVLETPTETPDGAGGVRRDFVEHSTVWAAVEPVSGGFRFATGRTGQTVTHRILMRAGPPLTAETRLRDGTRIYQIRSHYTAGPGDSFVVALTEEMTG